MDLTFTAKTEADKAPRSGRPSYWPEVLVRLSENPNEVYIHKGTRSSIEQAVVVNKHLLGGSRLKKRLREDGSYSVWLEKKPDARGGAV